MKISTIKDLLQADVLCCDEKTAEMMDMVCIVFVRSKQPSDEILRLAEESGIVVMSCSKRMYDACGILYKNGLVGSKTDE